jgi:hypothetical protein
LSPRPYSQNGKDHRQDQKPFLHFLSTAKQFGFWSLELQEMVLQRSANFTTERPVRE